MRTPWDLMPKLWLPGKPHAAEVNLLQSSAPARSEAMLFAQQPVNTLQASSFAVVHGVWLRTSSLLLCVRRTAQIHDHCAARYQMLIPIASAGQQIQRYRASNETNVYCELHVELHQVDPTGAVHERCSCRRSQNIFFLCPAAIAIPQICAMQHSMVLF